MANKMLDVQEDHKLCMKLHVQIELLRSVTVCYIQSFRNRLFRVTFIFEMTSLPGALWPCKEAQDGV